MASLAEVPKTQACRTAACSSLLSSENRGHLLTSTIAPAKFCFPCWRRGGGGGVKGDGAEKRGTGGGLRGEVRRFGGGGEAGGGGEQGAEPSLLTLQMGQEERGLKIQRRVKHHWVFVLLCPWLKII